MISNSPWIPAIVPIPVHTCPYLTAQWWGSACYMTSVGNGYYSCPSFTGESIQVHKGKWFGTVSIDNSDGGGSG